MIKEKLECQLCKKNWLREVSRGRKPRFCPKCLEKNILMDYSKIRPEDHYEEVDDSEELEDINSIVDDTPREKLDPKNKLNWVCPQCSAALTTYVALSCPPVCNNPASHSSKYVEMVQQTREKEKILVNA